MHLLYAMSLRTMYICRTDRLAEPDVFVNKTPPILLINTGQAILNARKNKATALIVKELPSVIFVGKDR